MIYQLETVGPGQIETGAVRTFRTLEELVDGIQASGQPVHAIINHGNPDQGLLIRFASNSPPNATGLMVNALAELVNALSLGALPAFDPRVVNAAAIMSVDPVDGTAAGGKFLQLRQQTLALHFRGCNLGRNTTILKGYKLVFTGGELGPIGWSSSRAAPVGPCRRASRTRSIDCRSPTRRRCTSPSRLATRACCAPATRRAIVCAPSCAVRSPTPP